MERESFSNLLVNFTSLNEAEANELASLANEFPYSQVIHNLAARSAQDNNLSSKENLLHVSAIYSTDRTALKSMMTAPRRARSEIISSAVETATPQYVGEQSNEDLRNQLAIDLAALQESRRLFEQATEGMETHKAKPLTERKKEKVEPVKEKTEPIKVAKGNDVLIEEIKSTKKKIKPEDPKQIEQIEIIDQFIKTQPSISRTKNTPLPSPTGDLAEPSSQFGENIVSETLVEILLKQGKKEKAIDALKKLIWKFPQKKAYFAAQIEELRK